MYGDSYGNRTSEGKSNETKIFYKYKYGNLLSKIGEETIVKAEYGYNADGIRNKKTVGGAETKYYLDGNKILREKGKNEITYFYGKDGLLGFRIGSDEYTYVRDCQGNISMLFSVDKQNAVARYDYDLFGKCTVYGTDGRNNTEADFIGNINPFRWKGFYFDTESGFYYANGSYYDPITGLYLDASPVNTVLDNASTPRSLDRNAPVCNNILELAGNPSTAFAETELSPDPNYNFESSLPDWLLRRRKRQQKLAEALQWYNDLHWGWKLGIGIGLLLGAVILTAASGHGWIGVASVFTQVAIGVGVGVGMYLLGALFHFYDFSLEGLGNAALDSFLASSAIVFISSSVSFIKHLSRSKPVSTAELAKETSIRDISYDDLLPSEKAAYDGYSKHGWRGNYPGQAKGVNAGGKYLNDTHILPDSLYHEFDINPAIQGLGRDSSRFVVSSDYVVYLTRDHYTTFFRVIK